MDTAFIFSLVIILDIESKDNNAPPPPMWDTFQLGTHPFKFRKQMQAASSSKSMRVLLQSCLRAAYMYNHSYVY